MSVKRSLVGTGLASATSANGTARNGAAQPSAGIHPGTFVAEVSCTIVTGSVVATFALQGSMDDSTYVDIKMPNNAANVTFSATGTGALCMPTAASVYPFFRCKATLSGASTAGGDLTAVTYRYIRHGGY